jgi:hypothetical protein
VELTINRKKILLSSYYRPPSVNNDNFLNNLNNFLSNLHRRNITTYVFSDTNINLLKLPNNNIAAEYLETVHSNGFLQLISKATRIVENSYSLIDHILCNNFKPELVTGTILLDISDHFMNFISMPMSLSNSNPRIVENKLTRDISFINLTNFKNDLGALNWNEVTTLNEVDVCFNAFWDTFSTLFNLHFPLTKFNFNKNRHSKNYFMTTGLLISRARKLELHKKSLIDPARFSTHYREYRNIFNSLIRTSKKLHYDAKFALHAKNPKMIWNLLNEISGSKKCKNGVSIPYIEVDGKTINSPLDIANEFNSFFATAGQNISEGVPSTNRTPESYFPANEVPPPEFNLGNINATHILDIIKSFPNKQSTDIDGLSLKLLKFVSNEISIPLAHIFYLSFTTGKFPSGLKTNRTVPIFKAEDPCACDNYHPISLIPTLSKILEKIVAINLTNHLQLNKLLHKNQFGFQRNTSTEHNILKVFNFIGESLNKGNYCIGVFLDLRKAFDTCSHEILLKKLFKLGIRNESLDWFKSYLNNRSQRVEINGYLSDILNISCGVFQGSVLGPILFLCYINDIFNASSLATFLFADDTTCLAENPNLHDLISYVNTELNKLAVWFKANKMAVNVSKTNYIIFHTRGKTLNMNGCDVVFNSNDMNANPPQPRTYTKN